MTFGRTGGEPGLNMKKHIEDTVAAFADKVATGGLNPCSPEFSIATRVAIDCPSTGQFIGWVPVTITGGAQGLCSWFRHITPELVSLLQERHAEKVRAKNTRALIGA